MSGEADTRHDAGIEVIREQLEQLGFHRYRVGIAALDALVAALEEAERRAAELEKQVGADSCGSPRSGEGDSLLSKYRAALDDALSVCETLPGKINAGNHEGALTELEWLAIGITEALGSAGSSKGRTAAFEAANLGSSPSPAINAGIAGTGQDPQRSEPPGPGDKAFKGGLPGAASEPSTDGDSQLQALRAALEVPEALYASPEAKASALAALDGLLAERDVVRDALRQLTARTKGAWTWARWAWGEQDALRLSDLEVARGLHVNLADLNELAAALAVSVDEPPTPELGGTAGAVPGSGGASS